jgi:hypothetical protein
MSLQILQHSKYGCPSRKPHPGLKYLKLERSSAILLDCPTHSYSYGLLHIYGPHLCSLFAHPEPDRLPNNARGGEFRPASATGRPHPENSPAATPDEIFDTDRKVKQRCYPMLGFKTFGNAEVTVSGIELANKIKKGRFDTSEIINSGAMILQVWEAALAA